MSREEGKNPAEPIMLAENEALNDRNEPVEIKIDQSEPFRTSEKARDDPEELLPQYSKVLDEPWYEAIFSALPTPLEVQQLRSVKLRLAIKFFFALAAVICLVTLIVVSFQEKRNTKFLALDEKAGDCEKVLIETIYGDWYIDWDGHWSTSDQYDSTQTFLHVKMTELPAGEYGAAIEALTKEFDKIAQADRSLTQNLLLAMTYKATYQGANGGTASAWFEASAETLLMLTSTAVGVTGCPPSELFKDKDRIETYEMGYRKTHPDFVYANDVIHADGVTTVSWTEDATAVCAAHPLAWTLQDWLAQIIEYGSAGTYKSLVTEHDRLTFDWYSMVAAAAINNKLLEPTDFMEEIDSALFTISSTVANRANSTKYLDEYAYDTFMDNGYSETQYDDYGYEIDTTHFTYDEYTSQYSCPNYGDFFGKSPASDNSQEYDVRYFADSTRKPGMRPIACIHSSDEKTGWVCSALIGGAHAYPLLWHHIDKCNHCSSESGLSYNNYNSQECIKSAEHREWYGGAFIKPTFNGPFVTHPYPQEDNWISSQNLDTATFTKFISYEVGYSMIVSDKWNFYYATCPVVEWPEVLFLAFNNFEQASPRSVLNDWGFINRFEDWHCTSTFVDQAAADLVQLVEKPPIDLDETYFKCTPSAWSAFVSSVGESEGNAQLLLILLTIVITHGVITWLAKRKPHYFEGSILIREDHILKTNLHHAAQREFRRRGSSVEDEEQDEE